MSESSEVKVIWETTDYSGRPVVLTTERLAHIEQARISEGVDWPMAIRSVIETPDMVIGSEQYADTEVHCKIDAADTFPGLWLHVPVLYQLGVGDVRTAIPTRKPKKGTLLFMRPGIFE